MIMRDILDKLAIITESTGLAGRKPGDVFRNAAGEEITFNSIQFVPVGGGKLEKSQLDTEIKNIEQQIGKISWQNARSPRTGGFALASFVGPTGEFFAGRYLEQIKPNPTDNFVPNEVDNYKFAGKAAIKAQAGLSPQDLLKNKNNQTISSIMSQLEASLGKDHPLYGVAQHIASGEKLPYTFRAPTDISFSGFRDYFCEILQPMALQMGLYTGNAGEAAKIFLDGSFEGTFISFDDSKTAGLSDSIITSEDGRSVKISSKGGSGATASSKNLLDSVDELSKTPDGVNLLRKYSDVIEMLREIRRQGQVGAPLYLGMKFNIIDETDAAAIRNLKNSAPIDLNQIESMGLSEKLMNLALDRDTDTPGKVNLYYHLIAAVAHKAAIEVNDKTDFSKVAATILNNGALIQIYTNAKQGKDNWILNEFQTVYPGESIKGVYFSAGKTYYSTGIKGNFTFKIDKGSGIWKDEGKSEITPKSKSTNIARDEEDFLKKSIDIVNKKSSSSETDMQPTKIGDVGRKKR